MTTINCIVVDDKPLALDILKDYIGKVPFLHLVNATMNPLEALEWTRNQAIDLIFLDIQMPEITGLQFLKILNGKCKVILTTAYSEYALEGYEHDVVDYLMKPIPFERFYKAALKAQSTMMQNVQNQSVTTAVVEEEKLEFMFVKTEHKIQKVQFSELHYIEGMQNYVVLHTAKGRVMTLQNIKSIAEKLPAPKFIRVHKSYIVAVEKIDTIERNRIFVGDKIIPLGDVYREAFFQKIGFNPK